MTTVDPDTATERPKEPAPAGGVIVPIGLPPAVEYTYTVPVSPLTTTAVDPDTATAYPNNDAFDGGVSVAVCENVGSIVTGYTAARSSTRIRNPPPVSAKRAGNRRLSASVTTSPPYASCRPAPVNTTPPPPASTRPANPPDTA
jgi:hypothetical protein